MDSQEQMYARGDYEILWRLTDGGRVMAHVTVFPDKTVFAIDDVMFISTWNSQIVDHAARFAHDERSLLVCGYSTRDPMPIMFGGLDFDRIAKALERIAANLEKMANPLREVPTGGHGKAD